ncbi:hypothetical protein [Uliginosibacterium gangwonense]|uniref:hypothetical protein n=1 Tax=Uliginosibacterium gangwonense TaxID=392736 RepID=UPI0003720AC0|nr:hypothetical protein [Uliginosibacterium gangwonense]
MVSSTHNRLLPLLRRSTNTALEALRRAIHAGEAPALAVAELQTALAYLTRHDTSRQHAASLWLLACQCTGQVALQTLARTLLGTADPADIASHYHQGLQHPLTYLLHTLPEAESAHLIEHYRNHPAPVLRMAVAEYLMARQNAEAGLLLMVDIAAHCGYDHATFDAIAIWLGESGTPALRHHLLAQADAAHARDDTPRAQHLKWAAEQIPVQRQS